MPGAEGRSLRWADDVVDTLRKYHGCLGVGVLHPGPDGGEHQIVFRFVDGVHLREWERSPQRAALIAEAGDFVVGERVQRTVGIDDWFELSQRAEQLKLLAQEEGHVAFELMVPLATAMLVASEAMRRAVGARYPDEFIRVMRRPVWTNTVEIIRAKELLQRRERHVG